jgi:hypothetical protein
MVLAWSAEQQDRTDGFAGTAGTCIPGKFRQWWPLCVASSWTWTDVEAVVGRHGGGTGRIGVLVNRSRMLAAFGKAGLLYCELVLRDAVLTEAVLAWVLSCWLWPAGTAAARAR